MDIVKSQRRLFTHCLRCGRKLKDAASQERGYGVVCLSKITMSQSKKLFSLAKK